MAMTETDAETDGFNLVNGFDFAKLRQLNKAGKVVGFDVPSVNFEELKKRSKTEEVIVFAEELEAICKSVTAFKEKYPQIYS
jgi:hypothetical protein